MSRKGQEILPKLLLMANRKLQMHFRLASRSMTLDDLGVNCYKFEFSENFAGFRRFGRQQRLNVLISNSVVTH